MHKPDNMLVIHKKKLAKKKLHLRLHSKHKNKSKKNAAFDWYIKACEDDNLSALSDNNNIDTAKANTHTHWLILLT